MNVLRRLGQSRDDPTGGLGARKIGNATVVHQKGRLTAPAKDLALKVAEDAEYELVVIDLPANAPISAWESVARCVPRGRKGIRLVLGGRSRETTAMAGQWLAERLNRVVVAPDGAIMSGSAGSLLVGAGRDSGWIKFVPGREPTWDSKRFPKPQWEFPAAQRLWTTSATGVAEPVPGGMWIRPARESPMVARHRGQIGNLLLFQRRTFSIVLGTPGAPPIDMDDVARYWVNVPASVRAMTRFVPYGPIVIPQKTALGQALADVLDQYVVCAPGMPVSGSAGESALVRTVRTDGSLGWAPYVCEQAYQPRRFTGGRPAEPAIAGYRRPIDDVPELSPGVYWYAADAVLEVIPAGLWMRPPAVPADAVKIRAAPVDPSGLSFVFDSSNGALAARMQSLAQDAAKRLDGQVSRFVASTELTHGAVGRTLRLLTQAAGTEPGGGAKQSRAADPHLTVGRPAVAHLEAAQEATTFIEAPTVALPAVPNRTEATAMAESVVSTSTSEAARSTTTDVVSEAEVSDKVVQVGPASLPPTDPEPTMECTPSQPVLPVGFRLESALEPRQEVDVPEVRTGPVTELDTGAGDPERAAVRVQEAPAPDASAVVPDTEIGKERAWLRRTLSQQYDGLATSIARLLSQHPGLRTVSGRTEDDLIADLVAVRLYLGAEGATLDDALRTATVGPHVPFARCVVAGMKLLPSHRGVAFSAVDVDESTWQWYSENRLITEQGFLSALPGPFGLAGDCDVLVWSLSGRRTALAEHPRSGLTDRVLFFPGTRFKVLDLHENDDGSRALLLREVAGEDRTPIANAEDKLDEVALGMLRRSAQALTDTAAPAPADALPPWTSARFRRLPGLLMASD
ncbi:hypothetical protein ACWEOG_02220 [Amycolatopsis japonica]